jgi:hypothetical protein
VHKEVNKGAGFIFERLYNFAQKFKDHKEQLKREFMEEADRKEMEGVSFMPRLEANSSKWLKRDSSIKLEDRLRFND